MSIHDEEQFEKYLKQFQPVAPEPLIVKERVKTYRGSLVYAGWAAAAVILIAVMVSGVLHKSVQRAPDVNARRPMMEEFSNPQPLTIEGANALLEGAPSFKAAVDDLAFQPESKPISEGRYSLLALLSKEEVKQ